MMLPKAKIVYLFNANLLLIVYSDLRRCSARNEFESSWYFIGGCIGYCVMGYQEGHARQETEYMIEWGNSNAQVHLNDIYWSSTVFYSTILVWRETLITLKNYPFYMKFITDILPTEELTVIQTLNLQETMITADGLQKLFHLPFWDLLKNHKVLLK